MQLEAYLPVITAALTLANTLVLVLVHSTSRKTRRAVNGMQLQLLHEAEERGKRLERHRKQRSVSLGE